MPEPRIIKRYANRKMYDTSRSCYVTLEEVAEMVRDGHEVRVVDNRTKADLTEVTLTQALLDSERKRRGTVPLASLRHLIAQGNEFLSKKVAEPVSRVREEASRSVTHWRDEAGKTVQTLRTEAEKVLRKDASGQPIPDAMETPPAKAAGNKGTGKPGSWQAGSGTGRAAAANHRDAIPSDRGASKDTHRDDYHPSRLEERLRQVIHALGLHVGDGEPAIVPGLVERIAALEARVAALESARDKRPARAGGSK